MTTKKMRRVSMINLIVGYFIAGLFVLLIVLNKNTTTEVLVVEHNNTRVLHATQPVISDVVSYTAHESHTQYVDHAAINRTHVVKDKLHVDVIDHDLVYRENIAHRARHDHHVSDVSYESFDRKNINRRPIGGRRDRNEYQDVVIDHGLLDRRLRDNPISLIEDSDDDNNRDTRDIDIGNLVVDDDHQELALAHDLDFTGGFNNGGGSGELYAYNFPSQGVGAGVGTPGVGAAGGYAGIGAGIGQAVYQGRPVPALGGVGTPGAGSAASGMPGEGSGGLVNGAGSGAAAGLMTGRVMAALGLGQPGTGGTGGYDFDHLPQDGALHIMLHVDGSGSILNTRKQLEIMRNTLLKDRLLPYYNDDEQLYNRRVTIIDSSGERSLKFFTQATDKDNVLAIAFQDEAQPVYHLPNFNKRPESLYLNDLSKLKQSLDQHHGVYRGVLVQVDRGKTFARSFKEFMENSFHGKGYLVDDNLKKYHRDDNADDIRNGTGVVFSDEYHVSDTGSPEYYMNLLMNVSARVGLDLNSHGGGLIDGSHVSN